MKTIGKSLLVFSLVTLWPWFAVAADDMRDAPMPTTEQYVKPSQVAAEASQALSSPPPAQPPVLQTYRTTSWFQTIDVTLRRDVNNNGYFSELVIRFDANTDYSAQPVYAIYSLIDSRNQEWRFHTSSIFTLYRQQTNDWFSITSDIKGLSRDLYRLRIQLKDANTNATLAEISGFDTATLNRLALEDRVDDSRTSTVIVVREESGGSIGIYWLLLLSCVGLWRWKQQGARTKR